MDSDQLLLDDVKKSNDTTISAVLSTVELLKDRERNQYAF